MTKIEEEEILNTLSYADRKIVDNCSESQRTKLIYKIKDGYKITGDDYLVVEVCKGFSYYQIDRSGLCCAV